MKNEIAKHPQGNYQDLRHQRNRPNQCYEIRENGSLKISTINTEPSMAKDSEREQSDVNNIMKKFMSGEDIRSVMRGPGASINHVGLPDYQQSLQTIIDATSAFNALPAEMRKKFENDPAKMIAYLENPKNNEEAIKLGLKEIPETPIQNQILNELKTQNTKPPIKTKTKLEDSE